jgi:hypothetical protein
MVGAERKAEDGDACLLARNDHLDSRLLATGYQIKVLYCGTLSCYNSS